MLWEVEIRSREGDSERQRVLAEWSLLTQASDDGSWLGATSRGFLLEGSINRDIAERLLRELLCDSVVEDGRVDEINSACVPPVATVVLRPGVMDPAALSIVDAAQDLGIPLQSVRTFRRYFLTATLDSQHRDLLFRKVLANDAIEQVIEGPIQLEHLSLGRHYTFAYVKVPLRNLDDAALECLSRNGQLALSLDEMCAIQSHFRFMDREPTDVELETIAQTWSEHCSHKTLKGRVETEERAYDNLLKETIFAATQHVRHDLGPNDWCVSVFEDNAGVVRFDERFNVCFKVETHNRPSALEPYGGANTGLGGVIRDVLGTGLGGTPICNTDVFCFAPPNTPIESLPPGVLHPRKIMQGVVAGVRDYGNRMGIPTVNGAVLFDARYVANPLVFCGTVGLQPADRSQKRVHPGDLIVAMGGRTGRDGIHGATFSSLGLTASSESESGGAVQIGNAINEKKLLDVLIQARDRNLFHAVTDCGAGGFSSAIGEMAAESGATVHLDRALLKYDGLSYTEIWISESQERMVLAVSADQWPILQELCERESVEAVVMGTFESTGRLRLKYHNNDVADLDLHFLHEGRPRVVHKALTKKQHPIEAQRAPKSISPNEILLRILAHPSIASKESIIRRYDHEVRGGTVIKPLVGVREDGPGDAAVITPVLGCQRGLAIGCGIAPRVGDIDAYAMAAAAIDEAIRNVAAVGADPDQIALLDNFCWGDVNDPETLGELVRACEACHDLAIAFSMPFISGKDSLYNEYRSAGRHIRIPGTLLISALGIVPDVRQCVTMDLKQSGNRLVLLGESRDERGGSYYDLVTGAVHTTPPFVDAPMAPLYYKALHHAIRAGLVRSCHDLSEGGLAVAIAEMAFAGEVGVNLRLPTSHLDDVTALFNESPTRWVLEVEPQCLDPLTEVFKGVVHMVVGTTVREPRLRIAGQNGEWRIWESLANLKQAWQSPLM